MCLTEEELRNPSRSMLLPFVLPVKVHFRYCWLFSGIPWHGTTQLSAGPLNNRDLSNLNRVLMSDLDLDICREVARDTEGKYAMKAFWLTMDGRLVYVNKLSEDLKFRSMRQCNLSGLMRTQESKRYSEMMRASSLAHDNLMSICEQAASLSRGRFYNLYAQYPLPITIYTQGHRTGSGDTGAEAIDAHDICNGLALLQELEPLYVEYFGLLADRAAPYTRDRVSLLGAEWLVEQDRKELQFSTRVRGCWFTRVLITFAFLLGL